MVKKGGHTQKQRRTKKDIQKKDDLVRTLSKKGGHRDDFVKKSGLRMIFAQIDRSWYLALTEMELMSNLSSFFGAKYQLPASYVNKW